MSITNPLLWLKIENLDKQVLQPPRLGVPDWAPPSKFGFARILPALLENKGGKIVLRNMS